MTRLIERLELSEDIISKNSINKVMKSGRKIRITLNGKTYKVIHRETDIYLTLIELKDNKDKLKIYISLLRSKARLKLK
jgi:uncharacterized protein YerC